MSLSHLFLSEHLHPLGNKSYGLEQGGCNIYPSFPNFAQDVGHCGWALSGSAVAV